MKFVKKRRYYRIFTFFFKSCKSSELFQYSVSISISTGQEGKGLEGNMNICQNMKQKHTKNKLDQHQYARHRNKGVKYTECDRWVKSRNSLNQHIRAVHEGVKKLLIQKN